MRKIVLAFFLTSLGISLFAQSKADILRELKNSNISNVSELKSELRKNGVSNSEAKRMAKLYGVDYDTYVDTYLNQKENGDGENLTETIEALEIPQPAIEFVKADTLVNTNSAYFGYNIFENNPFANKDYLVGNIDNGYVIAPGDVIRVVIWGSNSYQNEVKVDLNGNINLPSVGMIMVSGTTYGDLKKRLKNYLSKYFSGLKSSPARSFIDVSLTQIRPVKVDVLGDVNSPGPHLIGGFASALSAIYASGGIKTSGSLRQIELYRSNKLITKIDLYDYITKGHLPKDVRLVNNDVLFIPKRLSTITLSGAVKTSGIFELKPGDGMKKLLEIAGLANSASLKDVLVTRTVPFNERKGYDDVYKKFVTSTDVYDILKGKINFELEDGDIVNVRTINNKVLKLVTIKGSVNQPGEYSTLTYKNLKSLILDGADSLKPYTYLGKVDVYQNDSMTFKTYNLSDVLNEKINVKLYGGEEVVLYNEVKINRKKTISITGFVESSKTLIWFDGISLFDVVFNATTLEELEYKSKILGTRVDVKRYDYSTGLYEILTYNLNEVIDGQKVIIMPFDEVVLYSKGVNKILEGFVEIHGYVKTPGRYRITKGMKPEDLVLEAGGFAEFAEQNDVVVNRPSFNIESGDISTYIEIKLSSEYLLGTSPTPGDTLVLKHGDILTVRKKPGIKELASVTIEGEVMYPGVIVLTNRKQSLKDVINQAGGLTKFAYLNGSYILRDGKSFSTNLKELYKKNVDFLQAGDRIVIGSNHGDVTINGLVWNESVHLWKKSKRMNFYLKRAGGIKTQKGEKVIAIVKYNNGVSKRKKWYNNPKVLPDSEIIATKKVSSTKNPDRFSDTIDNFVRVLGVISTSLTTYILATKL